MDICDNIVISSRIRLARNISGINFHTKLTDIEQADSIIKGVCELLGEELNFFKLKNLSLNKCTSLMERHLISKELIDNRDISAVALSDDETISIMLLEEDHIREQSIISGFNLLKAYKKIAFYDSLITKNLNIATSTQLGYLTASPNNIGSGMRASCMMFLPAMTRTGKISDLFESLKKEGLTVRGLYGEGSKSEGYFYQVSNQNSFGLTQQEIIDEVSDFVLKTCEIENDLRDKLLKNSYNELKDDAYRAYGILTNSYILTESECLKLLSRLKLGYCLGLIKIKHPYILDELRDKIGEANLNELYEKDLKKEGNLLRAAYIQEKLGGEKEEE